MDKLKDLISKNCIGECKDITNFITEMICDKDDLISLSSDSLNQALSLEGEFLVLRLHYSNFEEEQKSEKIKYKISQALSVIVTYEDDGKSFEDINGFVNYIHELSDDKQNSIFGVKKVKTLSEYPITILFSGILPINQLKMTVGTKIDALIHSDDEYFIPRFQKFRDDLSIEVGIPILPVLPVLDEGLGDFDVRLVDLYDGRIISEFKTEPNLNKLSIENYLLKLFYIYKVLVEEKIRMKNAS